MEPINYSSVIIEVPDALSIQILNSSKTKFREKDLIGGLPRPHITIMCGLVSDSLSQIADTIGRFPYISATLGNMGVFIADNQRDSDVVKLDVKASLYLYEIRRRLDKLDHVKTYDNFYPHLTLAYVKPTFGLQYISQHCVKGEEFKANSVIIKNSKGESARLFSNGMMYKI